MENPLWPLNNLTLKVLSLSTETAFYEAFGLRVVEKSENHAVLSTGGSCRITLKQLRHGKPRPHRSAGLFHFALLLPSREWLGAFVRFVSRKSFRFVGASDHIVSESLYFTDEEGNGIEVYADRPREKWVWKGSTIEMDTLKLDLGELAQFPGPTWEGFPPGTKLGHMHLTVSNIDESQAFYESLGMQLTLNWGGFRFLAWDGYHHHVGINLLSGENASHVLPESSGLESFTIHRQAFRKEQPDPNGIKLVPYQMG
jgi:catechol 2,3-dioxygenase